MFQPQPTYFFSPIPQKNNNPPRNPARRANTDLYDNYNYNLPPTGQRQPLSQAYRGGGIPYNEPVFSDARVGLWGPLNISQDDRYGVPTATQRYNNNTTTMSDEETLVGEMAAQEAAALDYQPELKGPLVGCKKSSMHITAEYANADPTFVEKTKRLPQAYSHYRQVLGDGNCGWRAVGFSYFECLISIWDPELAEQEVARMLSFSNAIQTYTGYEEYIYEDMRDGIIASLDELASIMRSGTQDDALQLTLQQFNDGERSNQMLYYLRLIAAADLAAHPEVFGGFIEHPGGLEGHKSMMVQTDTEIEFLGLTALVEALLKPVNLGLEVVYLDRSLGASDGLEANIHNFSSNSLYGNAINPSATAYLLYRPGHYDILYKNTMDPQALRNQQVQEAFEAAGNIQVHRAAFASHAHQQVPMFSNVGGFNLDALSAIPGFSMGGMGSGFGGGFQDFSSMNTFQPVVPSSFTPMPVQMSTPTIKQEISAASTPISTFPTAPSSSHTTTRNNSITAIDYPPSRKHSIAHSVSTVDSSPSSQSHSNSRHIMYPLSPAASNVLASMHLNQNAGHDQFRQSHYVFEIGMGGGNQGQPWRDEPMTRQFRESHHNEAHHGNKNFRPYIWRPEDEEGGAGTTVKGRKRSAS